MGAHAGGVPGAGHLAQHDPAAEGPRRSEPGPLLRPPWSGPAGRLPLKPARVPPGPAAAGRQRSGAAGDLRPARWPAGDPASGDAIAALRALCEPEDPLMAAPLLHGGATRRDEGAPGARPVQGRRTGEPCHSQASVTAAIPRALRPALAGRLVAAASGGPRRRQARQLSRYGRWPRAAQPPDRCPGLRLPSVSETRRICPAGTPDRRVRHPVAGEIAGWPPSPRCSRPCPR